MPDILFMELFWHATTVEILLFLAALPGLILWLVNLRMARKAGRALRLLNVSNGRELVAKHQIRSTASWAAINALFVLISLLLMSYTRPGGVTTVREVIYTLAILTLGWLSYLAWDWRQVHQRLFGYKNLKDVGKK